MSRRAIRRASLVVNNSWFVPFEFSSSLCFLFCFSVFFLAGFRCGWCPNGTWYLLDKRLAFSFVLMTITPSIPTTASSAILEALLEPTFRIALNTSLFRLQWSRLDANSWKLLFFALEIADISSSSICWNWSSFPKLAKWFCLCKKRASISSFYQWFWRLFFFLNVDDDVALSDIESIIAWAREFPVCCSMSFRICWHFFVILAADCSFLV